MHTYPKYRRPLVELPFHVMSQHEFHLVLISPLHIPSPLSISGCMDGQVDPPSSGVDGAPELVID